MPENVRLGKGILSKDVELWFKESENGTFAQVRNLQEFPDLGGAAEKVDVTTLEDGNYKYINGIKDFGDLAFTFLYDNSGSSSNYRLMRSLEESEAVAIWEVRFPDGTIFGFEGQASTAITGAGVNAALQFTLTITLNSDIEVSNPSEDAADVYVLITRFEEGADPSELGWYEVADGVYSLTADTEVEAGKNYFRLG